MHFIKSSEQINRISVYVPTSQQHSKYLKKENNNNNHNYYFRVNSNILHRARDSEFFIFII